MSTVSDPHNYVFYFRLMSYTIWGKWLFFVYILILYTFYEFTVVVLDEDKNQYIDAEMHYNNIVTEGVVSFYF